jgi:pSer/pThr/pTyr-binding forkhead associated (FHA) protein
MMSSVIFLGLRFILVVLLYAFLGFALFLMWKELKSQSFGAFATLSVPLTLELISEAERVNLVFTKTSIKVGRDPTCECIIEDPTVSAIHAKLDYRQGHWWVEDLQSTNGTYINQEPVVIPMVIANGDELLLGKAKVKVSLSGG